jgi:pimeloyl-ACP methyl ester carboxylesterase
LGGNLNSWRFQIPELSKYFKVVAYDLRGHGYSECPVDGYSLNDQTEDLIELARHLGLPRFHAIGHSIGGSIALNAAIQYPDILDQLVAVAPPIEPTPEARLKESRLLL